jgi:hypothetical protein
MDQPNRRRLPAGVGRELSVDRTEAERPTAEEAAELLPSRLCKLGIFACRPESPGHSGGTFSSNAPFKTSE